MDTKPLERFAAQARRELLTAVEAQSSVVLAAGSVARSERGETVNRLEAEIAKHSRKHVIDKVAYTWFNRLIALRYMDIHGYTSAGVVSPAQGHEHGQPEILADAKSGHLDSEVITPGAQEAIVGLLDGTRRSTDAEGEAYALLLTEYCRYWNKAMPFMFEREGDYTELLVPAGLLADGGILSRARAVLTKDVCEDVEVIGWLYQFYISERKDEVFAGFGQSKKAGADEIPAATQLFTPHWIVRYLLENSLGRLWMLNRPESRTVDQMDYYIAPVDEETDFFKISGPEDLTVIDPACGSGHMLTYAFDLLYAIYEEEGYAPSEIPSLILNHNLHGTEIDPRAGALAAFALTMKARAKDRRFFKKDVEPKICVIAPILFEPDELDFLVTRSGDRLAEETFWNQFRDADTLGSLIQPELDAMKHAAVVLSTLEGGLFHGQTLDRARQAVRQAEALSRRYSVVTANPPYMGSKNMDARLVQFAKSEFPESKADLFAMFIDRCLALTEHHGTTAMITMQSWMFISSYEGLRHRIVRTSPPASMVHLGERAFDSISGAVVSTTAFVLAPGRNTDREAPFIRVVTGQNEAAKQSGLKEAVRNADCEWRFTASSEDFAQVPGSPIAYWLSDAMRAAFAQGRPLAETAEPRKGLGPGDSPRFLRYWWEISGARVERSVADESESAIPGVRWFPFNKGGEYRKWWGNQEHVVDWKDHGAAVKQVLGARPQNTRFYFRPTVSWSKISSGEPAFRYYPKGWMFSDAGLGLYGEDTRANHHGLLAFLNSSVALNLLGAISPTLNFEAGSMALLPVLPELMSEQIDNLAESLLSAARDDWNEIEISWDYDCPSWLEGPFGRGPLRERHVVWSAKRAKLAREQQARETENNRIVAKAYGLQEQVPVEVPLHRVSLIRNVEFRYGPGKAAAEYGVLERADLAAELVSYAVGCMLGRFSLDEPGLILANQGATLQDYLAKVPSPTFMPDADNVIPIVDDGWFEDDIVEKFRQFLRSAFGAKQFEENLHFVEESLGVKSIRDYFIAKSNPSAKTPAKSRFYEDHVQRYKKRPIYWMFSSPKGSFNALINMHRYTPSTVSTVLNEYLREYRTKLEVALQRAEEAAAGGASAREQKEADGLRKVLAELRDYEHDVLYPLDIQKLDIDLDDGVLVNYLRLGPAVRDFGLEKDRTKVESWTWPKNRLEPRN
ncbi:BREX-1 system adenine-specific DNA-methyltransferase PglX [Pseudarthrobacter sp. NPDC058362]|uniref:BREX-1 system adenine-specific DNA-methyltransferase PglX n=1 Tax=Pseudarthrobacter sp. NPDC058362 TaxID=3346458 RepID=UPI0036690841